MNKVKSQIIVLVIFCLSLFLSGCETIKGASTGLQKDVTGFWGNLKNADKWWKENMW